jgi:hypothetical protein
VPADLIPTAEQERNLRGQGPHLDGPTAAQPEEGAENSLQAQNATTWAEARAILGALRGAEAPLFHGGACICEFFRNLRKPCPSLTHL